MKIYFAGAIRAGRDDRETYQAIIVVLKEFGEVLTEHIGTPIPVTGEAIPVKRIFDRDLAWLQSADLVVADVSTPSTGVGYELGVAEGLHIPAICSFRRNSERKISAMVEGNSYFTVLQYDSVEQLKKDLHAQLTLKYKK